MAARQTVEALGLVAEAVPALGDCDYGSWAGRALDAVQADEPEGLALWLSDVSGNPHGGESVLALMGRVSAWLAAQDQAGQVVAITHASVVRAAVVTVLQAPPQAFWRIDVPPLSVTRLRLNAGRWTLAATGVPLTRKLAAADRPEQPGCSA